MTIEPTLLDAGETLVWTGRPNARAYPFKKSLMTFPFGIVFFAFSLFWVRGAAAQGGMISEQLGIPFWSFGIPFVIVGAGMVLSPLWHLFQGTRTTYGLTNRRTLTVVAPPFARRLSLPLNEIRFVDVRPSSDGSGDIYFKETVTSNSDGYSVKRDGFVAVAKVAQVDQLLCKAIDRSVARRDGTSS
jgi:hypothetical protein